MGLRNYVLKNNEKPATHFIEVWKGSSGKYHEDLYPNFEALKLFLNVTQMTPTLETIAIFKIRMK